MEDSTHTPRPRPGNRQSIADVFAALRPRGQIALMPFTEMIESGLRFFNEGQIFWSVPLAYPPLAYLLLQLSRDWDA